MFVEQKKGGQKPSARSEHARRFLGIPARLDQHQMREERRGEREIERRILERKPELRRRRAAAAVFGVTHLHVMKAKVWVTFGDVTAAPVHGPPDYVEAVVGAGRVEISGQRDGNAADAGADVEYPIGRRQSESDEQILQFLADGAEVARADKTQTQRRQFRIGLS